MRVLVFCDDLYHPAATVRAGLAPLEARGFTFDWVEDATNWDPSALGGYNVALLSKSNVLSSSDKTPWLTSSHEGLWRDFVQAGGGLLAVHSGTASYKDVSLVRGVLGGVFVSHPPPCNVTIERAAPHAIVEGAPLPFAIVDEHYQMVMDDPTANVFLTSRSEHGVQPAGWTRLDGRGRVCVLTPGHTVEVWLHPAFQQLLYNGLTWLGVRTTDPRNSITTV